jgi:hypothetical protein
MDKNFVNIDDLVRQRLEGGEERERAGAWLRMSELLEKEMPVRPAGFMWRRMFSVIAVCAVIASLSLGGYEFSAYRKLNGAAGNNSGTDNTIASASVTPSAKTPAQNTNNSEPATTTAGNSGSDMNDPHTNTAAPIANNVNNNKNTTGDKENKHETKVAGNVPANNATENDTKQVPALAANNTGNEPTAPEVANTTNNKQTNKPAKKNNDNNNTHKLVVAANTPANVEAGHEAGKPAPAKEIAHHAKTGKQPATKAIAVNNDAPVKQPAAKPVALNNNNTPAKHLALNNNNTPAKHHVTNDAKAENKTVAVAHKTAPVTKSENDHKTTAHKTVKQPVDNHAVAVNVPATKTAGNITVVPGKEVVAKNKEPKNVNVSKLPLGAGKPETKVVAGNNKVVAKNNNVTNNGPVRGANKNSVAGGNNNKTTTPVVAPAKPGTTGNDKTAENIAAKEKMAKKGKKLIEKMVINKHLVMTTQHTYSYHLDTISREFLMQEFDLENEVAAVVADISPKPGGAANTNTNAGADNAPLTPGAAPSNTNKPGIVNKENGSKKSFGAKTMESLSQTFNDIKYHAGNVQFAPGITGGINGTFFGPNSFRGFQFGLTGTFVLNDAVSVMTELKYFHRINNNYTLSDNYYDYTANPNGGFNKQLHLNWYSFSTLHSFEMPLTARYSNGNFSFYAGVNLVYTFSVNTGAAQIAPGSSTPVIQTTTMENDNAAKLTDKDFNARFGVGYVFGMSYMISPKVSLDIRETQTFWDNAKSSGSQTVSGQLYKSPSFQLSLGYRLGSNKGRSKE